MTPLLGRNRREPIQISGMSVGHAFCPQQLKLTEDLMSPIGRKLPLADGLLTAKVSHWYATSNCSFPPKAAIGPRTKERGLAGV